MSASRDPQAASGSVRRFSPYPNYKDSGVEWLGEMPAGWQVTRLKAIAVSQLSNVDKKSLEDQVAVHLCNYTDVYYHDRITSDLDFMAATATPDQVRKFTLRRGDVLITKDSESWTDIAVPAVVTEDLPKVLCGYHLAHIKPKAGCYGPFLARAFSAVGPRNQFQVAANGITRFGLGGDAIASGVFAMPPEAEQRAIAAFLDRETARIDALVAKNERLIELLQEQRTALITRAVTKGIDPTAPMKDSDVEWVGEIPLHWQVPPLYARFSVELGKMLDEKRITGEHLLPYIRNVDVRWDAVNVTDLPAMDITSEEYPRYTLMEGDVLVCEGGEVGRTAIWRGDLSVCAFQKAIHRLRSLTGQDLPRFLYYVMHAAASTGVFIANGNPNTIPHLTAEKLRVYRFPFPPKREQFAIVEFLDRETTEIDALVAKVHEAIDRLKEFHIALISAAVTGKIDVLESLV